MFDNTPLRLVPDSVKVNLLKSISDTLGMNITSTTCVTTGSDILKQQGITDISKWNCLWITLAWGPSPYDSTYPTPVSLVPYLRLLLLPFPTF
ncbi:abc transporter g family member 2 [Quercus suber]|uniref:Abc transporter g family member 2 n=1 Tax=Quercus suber TaxID=58331 RepID=A0AAW0LKU1_QUESU